MKAHFWKLPVYLFQNDLSLSRSNTKQTLSPFNRTVHLCLNQHNSFMRYFYQLMVSNSGIENQFNCMNNSPNLKPHICPCNAYRFQTDNWYSCARKEGEGSIFRGWIVFKAHRGCLIITINTTSSFLCHFG